ncbi:protein scabrous [Cylas formicarius]|uniref:protein scabrous n=1 Tax=Cylas formicarius TaxID=197179 RepID=UPI0029588DF9|nr:protein scabrous [Cylas formicarius]
MRLLAILVACASLNAVRVQGVPKDDELIVLSKQVKALVERRTEDLRNIEENVRKIVFKGPEVEELRDQVNSLRLEIDQLRSGSAPQVPTQTTNEKLTTKWLSDAVAELKTEVAEFQASLNSSAILENRERVDARLVLFETDVSTLNRELQAVRRQNAKYQADLLTMREEFAALRAEWKKMAAENGDMRNEIRALRSERRPLAPPVDDAPPRGRHHKTVRRHLQYLDKSARTLHKENYALKSRVDRLEQTVPLANLTAQKIDVDKLRSSMLELLENVELVETKLDRTVPEFRKEISKVEVQVAQAAADVAAGAEERRNVRESLKAIGFSVSELQVKTSADREELRRVADHLVALEKATATQHSRLHDHILKEESELDAGNATKSTVRLVEELRSFESEYKSIVNKLPRDCGSVEGPSGVYLIAPGDAEPILARCDSGWTTVQKRYDGTVSFNRDWNDYGTGFGSATGEHWLGNRNLHRLTVDNCSALQVNMKDIYGGYWQATYSDFRVAGYEDGYRIAVGGYAGNASDAMDYQNRMEFSTVDNDRDISNTHCASNYEGGWWYSHCQHANLNGRYNLGLTWFDSARNEWIAVAESEMRVRRKDAC